MEGRFEYSARRVIEEHPLQLEDTIRSLNIGDTLTPGYYYLYATFYPADSTVNIVRDTTGLLVKKARLTVSVADVTVNQGEEMPKFAISYNGFVFGENESSLTTAPVATCNANTNEAGTYEIVISGGNSDNYDIDYKNGTLTVNKKDDDVAINETAAIFEVYPNPSNGAFFINAGDEAQEVRIFNSTGKLVKVEPIEGVTRIDISEYANGMYFVKVGNQTKTVIKQ